MEQKAEEWKKQIKYNTLQRSIINPTTENRDDNPLKNTEEVMIDEEKKKMTAEAKVDEEKQQNTHLKNLNID